MIGFVDGAAIYLVIALLIFFGVFLAVGVYLLIMDKKTSAEMASLPLDNNKQTI